MGEQSLTEAFAGVLDIMRQAAEAAWGYRQELERMGYSPTAAEQASLHLLVELQAFALRGAK